MGTKYPGINIINYNATPPSDDGSQVPTNEIAWNKHKLKLGDPLRVLSESINAALLLHVDESVRDLAGAGTILAADHKRTINQTLAGTVSIDDSANLPNGFLVQIKNSHTADITIDLVQPTDTLNTVAAGTFTLEPDITLTIIMNSSDDGFLTLLDNFVSEFSTQYLVATSDQNVASQTLTNDDTLFFTMEPNAAYLINMHIIFQCTATSIDANSFWLEPDGTWTGAGSKNSSVAPTPWARDEAVGFGELIDCVGTFESCIQGSMVAIAGGAGGTMQHQFARIAASGSVDRQTGSVISYKRLY